MSKFARNLTLFVVVYTCVEGFVINLSGSSKISHVYKDMLLMLLYASVFITQPGNVLPNSHALRSTKPALFIFGALVITFLAVPGSNFLAGIVAVKQRLFYIPLLAVAYYFIRDEEDVRKLYLILVVSSIPVCLFGLYLHNKGPGELQRLGGSYAHVFYTAQNKLQSGSYWRVPSTFNSSGQFGAYLLFHTILASALLMRRQLSRKWTIFVVGAQMLMILAIFVSGSRTPLLLLGACVSLILIFARQLRKAVMWVLFGYITLALGFAYLGAGVADRFSTLLDPANTIGRFQETYFGQLFIGRLLENPLGMGLGRATLGARHVLPSDQAPIMVESYYGLLSYEMGWLGLLAFAWATIAIAIATLRMRRQIRNPATMILWAALAVYVLVNIFTFPIGSGLDSSPINTYFWFSLGAAAKLADLERYRYIVFLQEQAAAKKIQQAAAAFR